MSEINSPISRLINVEPAIIKGLSSSECSLVITACSFIFLPLAIVSGFIFNSSFVFISIFLIGFGSGFWFAASWVEKMKRDRPDHYYRHWFAIFKTKFGLDCDFIRASGYWSLGRSMKQDY